MDIDNPWIHNPLILVYGPPGSGKSAASRQLAEDLALPFFDLDQEIEKISGMSISEIFALDGETRFREKERVVLAEMLKIRTCGVIALGGGALLDHDSRSIAERSGVVVCLTANQEVLFERLFDTPSNRPLLSKDLQQNIENLLRQRLQHYASFPRQIDTSSLPIEGVSMEIQSRLGWFHVSGMGSGYNVRVNSGSLEYVGRYLHESGFQGPIALVSDSNVWDFHGRRAVTTLEECGYSVDPCVIPPGEANKNISTLAHLWEAFLQAGLERGSAAVSLGGGVVGDIAGFAAATYLRGIKWVNIPTSLLAMVDASLGGKTGIDLPQGKNLAGAFHAPHLVLVDPDLLRTLPETEIRNGLAEVLKHGMIGDEVLFRMCELGWEAVLEQLEILIRRAISVKIRQIKADPYEEGPRAALNLGHTLGHALEQVSHYRLRHGEAVAIGMVTATRLAERLGIAEAGLAERITQALSGLGLPTRIPAGIDPAALEIAMRLDKKRVRGAVRLTLPVRVGKVRVGVEVPDLGLLIER
ncbi:MAG TPA: 3-dehydroquinate synthase [Anaerolineales bacterium]|nr:3-dehydroquinate synthase [Anaerolineales bacterium]